MNRRDVVASLFVALSAQADADATGRVHLSDQVFPLGTATTTKHPFGELTVYNEGKTDQLKYLTSGSVLLNPGQEPHPPHRHPEEEFMLVVEGTGEILVGGQSKQVRPGSLMFCESNHEHGIRNTGSTPMRFFYSKWLA